MNELLLVRSTRSLCNPARDCSLKDTGDIKYDQDRSVFKFYLEFVVYDTFIFIISIFIISTQLSPGIQTNSEKLLKCNEKLILINVHSQNLQIFHFLENNVQSTLNFEILKNSLRYIFCKN